MRTKLTSVSCLALSCLAGAAAASLLSVSDDGVGVQEAHAQEIQVTGPLAGAPAVRRLRMHREGRFDIAPHATFTLLDEFRRGIMPGLRLNYHFLDWLGLGVFGGYVFTYNTALSDELQEKAINGRNCELNPNSLACKRTAVSLCRGDDCLADQQLGRMVWYVAPQITLVPFRGKFSLFGSAFLDSDISIFLGAGIVGIDERKECEAGSCANADSFELEHRVTAGPTFGLGFNFYPVWKGKDGKTNSWIGFGAEFRGTPFEWNTSGFDREGQGEDEAFPDDVVDSKDRALFFNPMLTAYISFQLPPEIDLSD